jgi:acetyl-CoA carboxylase biotin carboxyl carrier protein
MPLDRINELLKLMEKHDLSELELSEKGFSIRLVKASEPHSSGPATVLVSGSPGGHGTPAPPAAAATAPAPDQPQGGPAAESLSEITSPIVGTFYRSPSPDADPFVDVGSHVEPDTPICIIEAMKVMNEVKAELRGVIRKVLVESGQSVEFGQPIFLVETAEA